MIEQKVCEEKSVAFSAHVLLFLGLAGFATGLAGFIMGGLGLYFALTRHDAPTPSIVSTKSIERDRSEGKLAPTPIVSVAQTPTEVAVKPPVTTPVPTPPVETPKPQPSTTAQPSGWTDIFNGKDLTGWNAGEKAGQVAVQDGYLYRVSGGAADIVYALPAGSVDISAQVYIGENGNIDFKMTSGTLEMIPPSRVSPNQWHDILIEVRNGSMSKCVINGNDAKFTSSGKAPQGKLRIYFKGGDAPERARNLKLRTAP